MREVWPRAGRIVAERKAYASEVTDASGTQETATSATRPMRSQKPR